MRYLLLFVVACSFIACQPNSNKINTPEDLIPSEAEYVIKINDVNSFTSSTSSNELAEAFFLNSDSILIPSSIHILKQFNTSNPIVLSVIDEATYTISTKNDSSLFANDSLSSFKIEAVDDSEIKTAVSENDSLYYKIINGAFFGSNNIRYVRDAIKSSSNLKTILETTDKEKVSSLIYNDSTDIGKALFKFDDLKFTDYSALDLEVGSDRLIVNGITKAQDSSASIINIFYNTLPQENRVFQLAPSDSEEVISITYNDYTVLHSNISKYRNEIADSLSSFLNYTHEAALIKRNQDKALLFSSLDIDLVTENIEPDGNIETFRDYEIFESSQSDNFLNTFSPIIAFDAANYYTIIEDFLIYSNSVEYLKHIISNKLNGNTIADSDAYSSINDQLSDEASLVHYSNGKGISALLNSSSVSKFNTNVLQYIYDENFAHVNGVFQAHKKRSNSRSVSEAFTVKLDADILMAPQTVKNHITKANDIVVQDINNTLYLISSGGSILWKKQIQGKVLGTVEQIDIYKNGRLQLAFATKNRLYVIDRNGKDVNPFPLKFNDDITQPLSVFDYDKNRNFRLLVTQSNSLLMYDAKGQSVSGFKFASNANAISSQPKHFRVGRKDYIVFSRGNNLEIINRQGKTRIDVRDNIRFSDNEIYLYQNKFTTTNTAGQLVQVNTKGQVNTKNLGLIEDHNLVTTSKTLVTAADNQLNIKSRTIDLDYGNYTKPQIFYLNDKIYITITDLQTKKVYLFDSQAKSIAYFPVFGTSSAMLDKLDKSRGLELITTSDSDTIIVYKLN